MSLSLMLQGGMGLYNMLKGGQKIQGLADSSMQSESDLRQPFSKSQGLLDRMTNFNQYSGQAMDLASMQGNKGVEDAMMMGMGGSQANAIRNRMKRSSMTGVYDKFNEGLSSAARMQQGIDSNIAGTMQGQRDEQRQMNLGLAGTQMGIGENIIGGPEGMQRLGAGLGSLGSTILQGGPGPGGGLLGWGAKQLGWGP